MRAICILIAVLAFASAASSQRIAILQPEPTGIEEFSAEIRLRLAERFKILDDSLADAAYRSVPTEDPFNLSTSDARRIGNVVGAASFILLRPRIQRRAVLGGDSYFEGYAIAYVIDSRTGSMLGWHIESVRGADEAEAKRKLITAAPNVAEYIAVTLKAYRNSNVRDAKFLEVPPEGSPLAIGLRTPVPYRRMRPEYTDLASNYGVRATVDIELDIEADGTIARTSIERWAGFGLEESVEKAVRTMNWRPAERGGKPLPMRILLRYNFVKVEKDDAP